MALTINDSYVPSELTNNSGTGYPMIPIVSTNNASVFRSSGSSYLCNTSVYGMTNEEYATLTPTAKEAYDKEMAYQTRMTELYREQEETAILMNTHEVDDAASLIEHYMAKGPISDLIFNNEEKIQKTLGGLTPEEKEAVMKRFKEDTGTTFALAKEEKEEDSFWAKVGVGALLCAVPAFKILKPVLGIAKNLLFKKAA